MHLQECTARKHAINICALHILKVSRSWKSTLWSALCKDITSTRALNFSVLGWDNSLYLKETKAIVTTDVRIEVRVTYCYEANVLKPI